MRILLFLGALLLATLTALYGASFTGTVTLTDKTVLEDVDFIVDHDARAIVTTDPASGQKRRITFDEITSIVDEQGHDITKFVQTPPQDQPVVDLPPAQPVDSSLIPRKNPKDKSSSDSMHVDIPLQDSWIESQDQYTVDRRQIDTAYDKNIVHSGKKEDGPRTFKLLFRIGGLYSLPAGWANKINPAPGVDGQVVLGFKNRVGLGLDASYTKYNIDEDFFTVVTTPNISVSNKNADASIYRYMLSIGGYWPINSDDEYPIIAFAELKGGVYYRKLVMEASLRDGNTGQTDFVSWEDQTTEGVVEFGGGLIKSISHTLCLYFSGTFSSPMLEGDCVPEDIPFAYTPPENDKPDSDSFNFHAGIMIRL